MNVGLVILSETRVELKYAYVCTYAILYCIILIDTVFFQNQVNATVF
jgi:hypothetical protein